MKISSKDWFSFLWRRLQGSIKKDPSFIRNYHLDPKRASSLLESHLDHPQGWITWIGHATFLIKLGKTTLLTDPFFGKIAGKWGVGPRRFAPPPIAIDQLPPIDAILCSHNHYDHLDHPSIMKLKKRFGPHLSIFCPKGLAPFFYRRGLQKVYEMRWNASLLLGDLRIHALPAIHHSGRTLFDHNRTEWCSFGIQGKGQKVFFSGDTAYDPHTFQNMQKGWDIALIGIGAYAPEHLLTQAHVTPEQAIQIACDIEAKNLVGMHWGLLNLSDEPFDEPINRFEKAALSQGYSPDHLWLMKVGETRPLKGLNNSN